MSSSLGLGFFARSAAEDGGLEGVVTKRVCDAREEPQVGLDGGDAEHELAGDLLVAEALGGAAKDLDLALSEELVAVGAPDARRASSPRQETPRDGGVKNRFPGMHRPNSVDHLSSGGALEEIASGACF